MKSLRVALAFLLAGTALIAQDQNARERARVPYQIGLEEMKTERFDDAARSFETAVKHDPTFDLAYYMLGRAHLARKAYASAVLALTRARNLYVAESSRQFKERQYGDQYRRERISELEDLISQYRDLPQTPEIQGQLRQLEERKRQFEDRDRMVNTENQVPAYVSLSLGSAHFRAGQLKEAEQMWLETVAADPRSGQAHNNLAVVYLETGRYDEADRAVRDAEKAGTKVQQALKDEIRKRRKAGTS